jgi:hypothetical protein
LLGVRLASEAYHIPTPDGGLAAGIVPLRLAAEQGALAGAFDIVLA